MILLNALEYKKLHLKQHLLFAYQVLYFNQIQAL